MNKNVDPNSTQALDHVRHILDLRSSQYKICRLQIVAVLDDDKTWKLVMGKAVFLDQGETSEEELNYGNVVVLEYNVTLESAICLLERLASESRLVLGPVDLHSPGRFETRPTYWSYIEPGYWPSDGMAFGLRWPTNIVEFSPTFRVGGSLLSRALHRVDKPFYPDISSLIRHRMGQKEVERTVWLNTFVTLLPDYRARLSSVSVGAKTISLGVEARYTSLDDLIVKTYIESSSVSTQDSLFSEGRAELTVRVPDRISRWHVALLSRSDGSLLDYRSSWAYTAGSEFDPEQLDENAIRDIVARGENEGVEFKQMPRDDNKLDLAETAIAFANSNGGLIIVGVADDAQITGASGNHLEETFTNILRDKIEPPIKFTPGRVSVEQKPIYVIHIPRGPNRPYMLRGRGIIYVRAGSTDRPATPYEVQEMHRKEPSILR